MVDRDDQRRDGADLGQVKIVGTKGEVVPLASLQTFRDWDVVFVRVGDTYEIRPVELGQRDAQRVEVRAGLKAGDQVVVEQSYLVKADIEKSGASHDH